MKRPVIYQLLPRLFGNVNDACVPNGTLEQNGSGHLSDITTKVLREIHQLGITHVWYTGVIEHAHIPDYTAYGIRRHHPAVVKGQAGSPYAITDYYSVDPDLALDPSKRLEEWQALVRRTHGADMKVLMDFVPNHVSRLYQSTTAPTGVRDLGADDDKTVFFSPDNNFLYLPGHNLDIQGVEMKDYREYPARVTGNDCYSPTPGVNDWYETVKLNYGRDPQNGRPYYQPVPSTWLKMRDILLYWAATGVDGWRCDMVHMVPLEFWAWVIPQVKEAYPHTIFIGELYDADMYRAYIQYGHFDYLYDKVVLYDTLRAIQCHGWGADALTGTWQRVDGLGAHMLNFLENHDEQRYASPQYAGDPSHVLPALVLMATINRGAVMIYAGQELGERGTDAEGYSGQDGRTTIFDYWSIPSVRQWLKGQSSESAMLLRHQYQTVLELVNGVRAIREGDFYDLEYANYGRHQFNPGSHYAYLRHAKGQKTLILLNFGRESAHLSVNLPEDAFRACGIRPFMPYRAKDLLTGGEATFMLSPAAPLEVTLPAYGAAVYCWED